MARRGKRGLTDEDRTLWSRVAATTTPLDHGAQRIVSGFPRPATNPAGHAPTADGPPATGPDPAPIPEFRIGERASMTAGFVAPVPAMPAPRMDPGLHRKMIRGRLAPEGRLDLHGMTLDEAHPALVGFLFRAHAAQMRLVLVITGKGKDRDDGGPIPIRRGILRQQVPAWLAAPPLGALVLDIREAHRRHGGGGALYVYLRRPR